MKLNLDMPDGIRWSALTPAQRRRAESLLLVRILYPGTSLGWNAASIARWIATGREPGS